MPALPDFAAAFAKVPQVAGGSVLPFWIVSGTEDPVRSGNVSKCL